MRRATASRRSICWWSTSIRSRRRSRRRAAYDDCVENIDIGGPAMIRAAAKNHADVAVVVDAGDYARAARRAESARRRDHAGACASSLAAKAYARTAAYDAAISNWFADALGDDRPTWRAFGGTLVADAALRREPAPERGVLSHRPSSGPASRPRGRCRARSSPTTTQRHRRGLRMRRRVRAAAHAPPA